MKIANHRIHEITILIGQNIDDNFKKSLIITFIPLNQGDFFLSEAGSVIIYSPDMPPPYHSIGWVIHVLLVMGGFKSVMG